MRRLLFTVAGEAGLVAVCHRLVGPHLDAWLASPDRVLQMPPGDLAVALLHVGAWLATWWLLLGTAHDVWAGVRGMRRGGWTGHRVAPAWVQRTVNQALGTLLVLGVMAGPASAASGGGVAGSAPVVQVVPPPVPVIPGPTGQPGGEAVVGAGVGVGDARADVAAELGEGAGDGAAGAGAAEDAGAGGGTGGAGASAGGDAAADGAAAGDAEEGRTDVDGSAIAAEGDVGTRVVAAGDNLWVIARAHLSADGTAPEDRAVHAYWLRLIQENLPHLRSGDADLVFPGEQLRMPDAGPAAPMAGHDPVGGDAVGGDAVGGDAVGGDAAEREGAP